MREIRDPAVFAVSRDINRYKSIAVEAVPYPLELVRYLFVGI